MSRFTAITALVFCVVSFHVRAVDRIWVAAEINGKPVGLAFDTGSSLSALSSSAAQRFGLTNSPIKGATEECDLSLGSNHCRIWFQLLDVPAGIGFGFDGLLGWNLWQHNILRLDAGTGFIRCLSTVPKEVATWSKIPLLTNWPTLALNIGSQNKPEMVLIDTGSPYGLALSTERWLRWRKEHKNAPATFHNSFGFWTSSNQVALSEECWTRSIDLGSIHLTEVPVFDAGPAQELAGTNNYAGTLGIAALRRFDIVIDGINGAAYLRPIEEPALPYDHERAALGFIPPASPTNRLVLRALKGGPAYEAGIRDGDILLTYNGHEVRGLVDLGAWGDSGETSKPPGYRLPLMVHRGSQQIAATVVFRDLIGPAFDAKAQRQLATNDFANLPDRLTLTPCNAYVYKYHAEMCEKAGLFDMAIADFNSAIEASNPADLLNPFRAWLVLCRGHCYALMGQYDKAIIDFTYYLKAVPNDGDAYARRGTAYAAVANFTNAIQDMKQALNFDPTNVSMSYELGMLYGYVSNFDKTIVCMTSFINSVPTNENAHFMRGYAYVRLGDSTNAINDLTLVLKWNPTNAFASYYMGCAFAGTGDYRRAVEFEEQALHMGDLPPELRADIQSNIVFFTSKVH